MRLTASPVAAEAFGEKIDTPFAGFPASPPPERIATASVEDIAKLGIVSARAKSIIALATAYAAGELQLEAGLKPAKVIKQLVALPGIGQWTAHCIAMRAQR